MEDTSIQYILFDNSGACTRSWPLLLPVGTVFKHEYGTYKVEEHALPGSKGKNEPSEFTVVCERVSLESL